MTTLHSTGPVRLLGWDDLRDKGIKQSKPTIYRWIRDGKFPEPVYPGKSPAWPEHIIDAHIMGLIAARDASKVEA
jgi:predicted DNA-binding transcriptional regulator AlpA